MQLNKIPTEIEMLFVYNCNDTNILLERRKELAF